MIRLTFTLRGVQDTHAALAQVVPVLMDEADAATRASLFQVTRTSQQKYLSGPRPQRLGVVTNRLRGSLSEGSPDLVFDVQRQALQVKGTVGTNVEYGPIHEYGGVIRPKRTKFLAVPTAFAKTPAGATKSQYNRPLRQIPNLFIGRSKSGILFAAEKTPATGRQRRSGFKVLFWLVRQVRIPARPFLAPSLRDNIPWITQRFTYGLRQVERRVNAALRGRR
jgi:phage gpG-like protein